MVERVKRRPTRLWLNSGCPTEKSLDKTTSSKSHAKQLKLKKSQCQWDFYKEEEAILSPLRLPVPPSRHFVEVTESKA
jgi:hypothetical protein